MKLFRFGPHQPIRHFNLSHYLKSKLLQPLLSFSLLFFQHSLVQVLLHILGHFSAWDRFHFLLKLLLLLLHHLPHLLFSNGDFLLLVSAVETKGQRDGHIELFVGLEVVFIPDGLNFILFSLLLLLSDDIAKLLVT